MFFSDTIVPSSLRYWVGDGSSEFGQGVEAETPNFKGPIYLFVKREERRALAYALREASDAIYNTLRMEELCNPA